MIAALLGTVTAVDTPTRQTFVMDMVGGGRVQNAVSLNSVLTNASRAVGPAIAGGLIASVDRRADYRRGIGVREPACRAWLGAVACLLAAAAVTRRSAPTRGANLTHV